MLYYILGVLVFQKLNGIFGIVEESMSLLKNGYNFYQWYYPEIFSDKKLLHSRELCILEIQNTGTQTNGPDSESDSGSDSCTSSPEIILFEQPYWKENRL
jgi:hypothetical protein